MAKMVEKLKSWNKNTYDEAIELFNAGERKAAIYQATGTGKSSIITALIERFDIIDDYANKIILVPQNNIGDQFREQYHIGKNVKIISYSKLNSDFKKNKLKNYCGISFIAADELHRTGAKKWQIAFKHLMDINPKAKVIGATATPIRKERKRNVNMIYELFDDNSIGNISFFDAIKMGILPNPLYHIGSYRNKEMLEDEKRKLEKKKYISDDDKQSIKDFIDDAILSWSESDGIENTIEESFNSIKHKNTLNIVIFCSNIAHMEEVENKIKDGFDKMYDGKKKILSFKYHSQTSDKDYEEFKKSLDSGTCNLLFVVNKLNEGVHLDSLDGGIMVRYTESSILFHQQLGRMLSFVHGGNRPIILDLVSNINAINKIYLEGLSDDDEECGLGKFRVTYKEGEKDRDVISTIFGSNVVKFIDQIKHIEEMESSRAQNLWEYEGKRRTADELSELFGESKGYILNKLKNGLNPYQIKELLNQINQLKESDAYSVNGVHYTFQDFHEKFKVPLEIIPIIFQTEGSLQGVLNRYNSLN